MNRSSVSAASPLDCHLFGPGPKRILALDGGGVRGIVALAFLKRIEETLAAEAGHAVRLCDYFDLIGGTSTGAIIAVALTLGYNVDQIHDFYLQLAPKVFRPPRLKLPGVTPKFDARALTRELYGVIGDRHLDSADLQTGLGVMLKRMDTASAWILTNNPRSVFWETPPDHSFIGNRHYRLAQIVRASTAAPHYFKPQEIEIARGVDGMFVDGGLTPHNNPSLELFLTAVLPGYRVNWETGPEKLTIVSVGAGSFRDKTDDPHSLQKGMAAKLALRAMVQLIAENQQLILTVMSFLGESPTPWEIDSQVGVIGMIPPPGGPMFRFLRYDIRLEADWFQQELAVAVGPEQIAQMRHFDDATAMPLLDELSAKAAKRQVLAEHWRRPVAAA
jgi:hypothetical protein